MSENNWEKVKYLPISSFVLISIIFLINLYFVIKLFLRLKQLAKFQNQQVVYFENKKAFSFLKILFSGLIFFYLLNCAFFITYLISFLQILNPSLLVIYYLSEVFFLFFLSWAIYFLLWITHRANALIIVIKNQKLILLNETILLEDVIKVFHDEKRKYIYVRWKDPEIKGNTCQVKIRYHYQIKDLLIASQVPIFFDEGENN